MASKDMKISSTLLVIMQIKNQNTRYHFTLTEMTIIKEKLASHGKFVEKLYFESLYMLFMECKMVQLLFKTVWKFFKRLSKKLTFDLVILLHLYPGDIKSYLLQNIYINIHRRLIHSN